MDTVLAWLEESLRLRCEVLRTMYGAPDFTSYAKALEQYTARVESPQLVCSNLQQRDEDDDEDTLEWLAPELEKVAPMYVLAIAHRGGDRYTFVRSRRQRWGRLGGRGHRRDRVVRLYPRSHRSQRISAPEHPPGPNPSPCGERVYDGARNNKKDGWRLEALKKAHCSTTELHLRRDGRN